MSRSPPTKISPTTITFMNLTPTNTARNVEAKDFRTKPWSVVVEGEVNKPAVYQLEDLIKPHALEGAHLPTTLR